MNATLSIRQKWRAVCSESLNSFFVKNPAQLTQLSENRFLRIIWSALLLGPAWLAYRKCYLESAIIILLSIMTGSVWPTHEMMILVTTNIIVSMVGLDVYLLNAKRKINWINTLTNSTLVRHHQYKLHGGVSLSGLIVSLSIYLSCLLWIGLT